MQAPEANEDLRDEVHSQIAVSESEIAKLKADLALKFEVPLDAVDIAISDEDGRLTVSYGLIFLSASDIMHAVAKPIDS